MSWVAFFLAISAFSSLGNADEVRWTDQNPSVQDKPIVLARAVTKSLRFQLKMDGVFADRRDLWIHWGLALGARFFINEEHGLELPQIQWQDSYLTDTARVVEQQTGFRVDSKPSRWQISGAYIWAPIYGKYAWNSTSLVHFDIYALAGAGVRFPCGADAQPFAQLGIGMNHVIGWDRLSIVPEYRVRFYSEQRTSTTFVIESLLSLGVAWLF
jgi:outer membrane beta-barrel protein